MRLVRPIFVLVIAVSVALLPMAGVAMAANGLATQIIVGASESTISSDPGSNIDQCCLDSTKAHPCDQQKGQCPIAYCAPQSVSIGFVSSFCFTPPLARSDRLPIPVDQVASHDSGSPPFRPPRI